MTKPSERTKNMKLSNAAPQGFHPKGFKLQKFKPFQALTGKLSGIKRLGGKLPSTLVPDARLSSVKSAKGTQVAFNLLLVRPWVLVIGFWLVSMVSAGMALDGLISPRKLTMDMPVATEPVTPKDAFIDVEQSADEIAGGTVSKDATAVVAPAATRRSDFPAWPLGALVGTCAAGCLVMSRRRAMARMAAARSRSTLRNESRGKVRKMRLSADMAGRSPAAVKKLSDRKMIQVPTAMKPAPAGKAVSSKTPASRPAVARSAAVQPAAKPLAPKVSQAKKRRQRSNQPTLPKPAIRSRVFAAQSVQQATPTARVAQPNPSRRLSFQVANRQPVVSVVPANEAHPLDWNDGSLAHQLDVRPQRSAM